MAEFAGRYAIWRLHGFLAPTPCAAPLLPIFKCSIRIKVTQQGSLCRSTNVSWDRPGLTVRQGRINRAPCCGPYHAACDYDHMSIRRRGDKVRPKKSLPVPTVARLSRTFDPGSSVIELGLTPTQSVTLTWPTFTAAANEAGISRRYGGIHFKARDLAGRLVGQLVGLQTRYKALSYLRSEDHRDARHH